MVRLKTCLLTDRVNAPGYNRKIRPSFSGKCAVLDSPSTYFSGSRTEELLPA